VALSFLFFLVRAAIQFTWGLHLNVILVYIFLVLGRGRRTLDCLAPGLLITNWNQTGRGKGAARRIGKLKKYVARPVERAKSMLPVDSLLIKNRSRSLGGGLVSGVASGWWVASVHWPVERTAPLRGGHSTSHAHTHTWPGSCTWQARMANVRWPG